MKENVAKFCKFIENTNGTNFLHNLATFGQYEVSKGLQNMETTWVISAISIDLTTFLMSSVRAVMLLHELASICA